MRQKEEKDPDSVPGQGQGGGWGGRDPAVRHGGGVEGGGGGGAGRMGARGGGGRWDGSR